MNMEKVVEENVITKAIITLKGKGEHRNKSSGGCYYAWVVALRVQHIFF